MDPRINSDWLQRRSQDEDASNVAASGIGPSETLVSRTLESRSSHIRSILGAPLRFAAAIPFLAELMRSLVNLWHR